MQTDAFYEELPVVNDFIDITNLSTFSRIPEDWIVVVTDVIGSKKAIDEGKYKEVNTLGAASITAILNALDPLQVPYTFGGDGASFCVPKSCVQKIESALLGTQNMAKLAYGLELRAGLIPVSAIRKRGSDILVAKYQVSKWYSQAIFTGGGMAFADLFIKSDAGKRYRLKSSSQRIEADFTGLECRWKKLSDEQKSVISLLVKAQPDDAESAMQVYKDVITTIADTFSSSHPVTEESMKFSFSPKWLSNEVRVRTFLQNPFKKLGYYLDLFYRNILGILLMKFKININGFDWGTYKSQFISNTDNQKFDDMLRVVISGDEEEKNRLVAYLDKNETAGTLKYGYHVSESALVTCMIKEYDGYHFHFVDGDEGGYYMAARHLESKKG